MDPSDVAVPRKPDLQAIKRDAMAALHRSGTLPRLTCALLFCLLVTFAVYCLQQLAVYLAGLYATTLIAAVIAEIALVLLELLLFLAFVMPLWLAKLRMAGLVLLGEEPPLSALFYYFTSPRHYARAWRIGAVLALLLLVPAVAVVGLFFGAWSLYTAVFTVYFSGPVAVLLLILCFLMAIAVSVLVLFFSGAYLAFAAVAVGNEDMRVRQAFYFAVARGKRNLTHIFLFSVKSLLWLLLSLATVGVLHVLWFSHYYNLSYMRLSMALCPKEEV